MFDWIDYHYEICRYIRIYVYYDISVYSLVVIHLQLDA